MLANQFKDLFSCKECAIIKHVYFCLRIDFESEVALVFECDF